MTSKISIRYFDDREVRAVWNGEKDDVTGDDGE
jgi:hypothetical protein